MFVLLVGNSIANPKHGHAQEGKEDAHVPIMAQAQALPKQLQRHAGHDTRRNRKQASVCRAVDGDVAVLGNLKPEHCNSGAHRLTETTKQCGPDNGLESAVQGHIQRQGHGKSLSDVVDEQGHEYVEPERRVHVVGGVGDKALGELVERNGDNCLQTDGKKGVRRYVMVVLSLDILLYH